MLDQKQLTGGTSNRSKPETNYLFLLIVLATGVKTSVTLPTSTGCVVAQRDVVVVAARRVSTMKAVSRGLKHCAAVNVTASSTETVKPFDSIPGPKSLPIVGTLPKYLPLIGEYSLDRLHWNGRRKLDQFGPLVREQMVPGVDIVWVFTPADIETVFRSEGRYPQRRSHLALQKYRLDRPHAYNTGGLLPTNGPDWMRLRSVFQRGLSSPQNVKSYLPLVDAVVQHFVDQVAAMTSAPADFLQDLQRVYLELICLVAFDVRLGASTPAGLDPGSRASRLIHAALTANSCILATDNGPRLWRYLQTRLYRKLSAALHYMETVAVELVGQKAAELRARVSPPEQMSLLELYLSSPELDLKDVVGMAVDMILAGFDTTSYTTSFTLYHLATNPGPQEQLHAESLRLLATDSCPVTAAVLSRATYTKAVLKETARMNPISVGVGRILGQDAVLSGYNVPAGTLAVTQNQVSCRLPQYFSQPDSFVPERWVKGHAACVPVSPYLVLPFGHGPRSCIARRLAEQNMQALLLKLVRRFRLGWTGGVLDARSLLINKPDQPISLTFTPR